MAFSGGWIHLPRLNAFGELPNAISNFTCTLKFTIELAELAST